MSTEKSKQAKQKLTEIFSSLDKEDLRFLNEYFDEAELLGEAFEVINNLLECRDPPSWKVVFKKAVLVIDKTDPKHIVDLYVDKDQMKTACDLVGHNRPTVALRIKGVG